MTSTSKPSTSDHWSVYWARGALTSLPEDFAVNYDGEIRQFWRSQFEQVPDGGRILDVCTGNGAIALLAAEATASRSQLPEILAVDAATIRPAVVAERFPDHRSPLERIGFIPDTRFEELDLGDESVDLISSQYGIEYCELERAAGKVARLLRHGGRLVMVCHAVSSDMLKTMEIEHRDYRHLDRLRLLERVEAFLDGELDPERLRRALARVRAELKGHARTAHSPLLRYAVNMIEGTLSMSDAAIEQARPHYRDFVTQLASGRDRLADMLRVNRLISENERWFEAFEDAGLAFVESGRIRYQGSHDVGRFFVMRKP